VRVHQLVDRQAAERPDALAVVAGDVRLTYRDLVGAADGLARRLRARAVGPDVVVGVLAGRTAEMVVACLGVLKAGGAYLPLDPDYPAERLAFMVEDAGLAVVVAAPGLRGRLPAFTGTVLAVANGGGGDRGDPGLGAPDVPTHPGNLAYVVYTSGSTGRPKGVLLHHAGLENLVHEQVARFGLDPTSRVLQLASFSFDASVSETFTTLAAGGTLVLADRHSLRPGRLGDTLRHHRITAFTVVPSTLATIDPEDLPDLATIVVAGEACSAAVVAPWTAGRRVLNAYGPSEATVCATMSGRLDGEGPPPLGQALGNLAVHVLDDGLEPVPPGGVGELYVGGVGVARGYLGRPGLTAARFLPDPFAATPGARMYATGDLARRRGGGGDGGGGGMDLAFVGRLDEQVKIRGVRIELGEVEAALASVPGVRTAAAAVHEQRLVGYVVPAPGREVDPAEVRRQAAARLPQHLVPRAVVALPALPQTPNGKVDRAALPPPDQSGGPVVAAPRNDVEARLAALLADVLDVPVAGVFDDFFDLGGDSLLAATVVARVRHDFGVEVGLSQFVADSTAAGLASAVAAAPAAPPDEPIPAAPPEQPVPLSPGQARLWFLEELAPDAAAYNVPAAVAIPGPVDQGRLAEAVAALAQRHPVLTSRVVMVAGEPCQERGPDATVPISTAEAATRAEAEAAAIEFVRAPFDLGAGPLARVGVWSWPAGSMLCVAAHHIAVDGLSVDLLLADLALLYRGVDPGPRPSAFSDIAAWQHRRLASGALDGAVDWWRERLAGAPGDLGLPADRRPPLDRTRRGAQVCGRIPPAAAAGLRAVAREQGTTSFSALLAAFAATVIRYGGHEDVVVGSPFAGRARAEWEGVVGFFVNTVVLRTDCSGNPAFAALVGRVADTVAAAWGRQEAPFERLVAELRPARDAGFNPLFQAMFAVERAPLAAGDWERVDLDVGTARFDLELVVRDEGRDGFAVTLRYDADLYEPATAAGLVDDLVALAASAAADPGLHLADLDVAERAAVPAAEAVSVDPAPSVVSIMADLARRQPDAPAVIEGEEAMSYGGLQHRAAALARVLAAAGAGPGAVVGMCVERSTAAVAAWLAIMQTGAAYLPLDPEYPADRLAWMADDAGVTVAVVGPGLENRLPAGVRTVAVDGADGAGDKAAAEYEAAAPLPAPGPGDLAYVFYTSGSTGLPKGVMIEHRSLAAFACWYRDAYEVTPADRATVLGPLSFDISVLELWPYLVAGASVVIAPPEVRFVPSALSAWLDRAGITIATLVTPLCEAVLDAGVLAVPGLRLVHTGGDRLTRRPPPDADWVLVNNYGPTECTVAATSGPVGPAESASPEGSPPPDLGGPVGASALHVLDRWGGPVPVGGTGELHVGGTSLARGYLGRAALTAERFVPDPFGPAGSRLYRTGDRVRRRGDGRLDFLGRVDQQLKLRGHRIEPAEVEAALLACPGVVAAAVTVVGPHPDRQRLVAYAAGPAADVPPGSELRARLRDALPAFMVPADIVRLDALPLLPSGKVDRAALPAPEPPKPPALFAGSPLEQAVAAVWKAVLETDVGLDDNFFDLGGTSLLLAHVQAALAEQLHVHVSIQALFGHPTVAALARYIQKEQRPESEQRTTMRRRSAGQRASAVLRRGKRSKSGESEQERPVERTEEP
jgi:amino acid adenylation domain-containing protein